MMVLVATSVFVAVSAFLAGDFNFEGLKVKV